MFPKSLATFVALLLLAQVSAQEDPLARVTLPGESERTARRLAAIDALLAAKQVAEAIKELEQVLRDSGDDLVPAWTMTDDVVHLDRRHCRQARWLCHVRFAALPTEARQLYQQRVEAQARQWLEQGEAHRDPAPLRKLVEEAFCSTHGARALDLLGDLAFERGDFEEALRWYAHLAPSLSETPVPGTLVTPDANVDRAHVRAKQLLARLLQGEDAADSDAWPAFRKEHGDKEGHLAGRTGNLATILDEERSRIVTRASLRALRWTPQPRLTVALGDKARVPIPRRTPGQHLVVADGYAFWADARRVTALDLVRGTSFHYELPNSVSTSAYFRASESETSFTLHSSDGRIFARLGAATPGPASVAVKRDADASFLVCLEPQPNEKRFRERWLVPAPATPTLPAVWEGAPVVRQGRAYTALTRMHGERARTALCCLDADTGRLIWEQDVCEAEDFKSTQRRGRSHRVTCAGGLVIYCGHAGAVAAVDASTGRRAWAVRYTSRGPLTPQGRPSPRDPAPCLAAGDKVYVAPSDYGRILCLHLATGRLLWESNPLETVHLLGVAKGQLIITATTPYACVRALDTATGRDQPGVLFPEEDAGLVSLGRGVLAEEALLWPTNAGLHVLDDTTLRPRPETLLGRNLPGGNVVLTPAHLLIADREAVSVYDR